MTDIRVAAEQARVALPELESALNLYGSDMREGDRRKIDLAVAPLRAALASLEAALAALPGDKIERHVFSYGDIQNWQDLVHPAVNDAAQVPQIAGRDGASDEIAQASAQSQENAA